MLEMGCKNLDSEPDNCKKILFQSCFRIGTSSFLTIWKWFIYTDQTAIKLVLSVEVINIFCSLSLGLLRLANLIFSRGRPNDQSALPSLLYRFCHSLGYPIYFANNLSQGTRRLSCSYSACYSYLFWYSFALEYHCTSSRVS